MTPEYLVRLLESIKPWDRPWEDQVQSINMENNRNLAREQFALRQNSSLLPTWSREDWDWVKGLHG
jgi:hypothetical protein